jgi:hypothetical protein
MEKELQVVHFGRLEVADVLRFCLGDKTAVRGP